MGHDKVNLLKEVVYQAVLVYMLRLIVYSKKQIREYRMRSLISYVNTSIL
ncbi:hypothetical protein F160043M1_09570 [Anaerostipes hadrus]